MAFHFFTNPEDVSQQVNEQAFGALPNSGELENYHLQNTCTVTANAPAFAITKSILIAFNDSNNSNLLNMALLPIESNYTAGFPIKFFVYRGISKSSLLASDDTILPEDNTWDNNNILGIIKELQDKINEELGTTAPANSTSLGLQFDTLLSDTLVESILFDTTDDFHPLIVPRGCQIGKFAGGGELAGMEVILDQIGQEATIGVIKESDRIFQIPILNIDAGLSEKEQLKLRFQNRTKKEQVLAYMDITAFYGACENQGINVKGVSNNTDYLELFLNKNKVYIDIRDSRGFSYNHFYQISDNIEVGFYDANNEIVYESRNYYNNWPLLTLDNESYNTSRKYFGIKLPIVGGMPEYIHILSSFTKKVSIGSNKRDIRYATLNDDSSIEQENPKENLIRLKNWNIEGDELGANYFLLKLDRIIQSNQKDILAPVWNSFFSLKMKNIFSTDTIEDGEFRVKTYSALNTPLLTDNNSKEIFSSTIGIVADKYRITFFSMYTDSVFKNFSTTHNEISQSFIETGRYKYIIDADGLDPNSSATQSAGFLWQIANNSNRIKGFRLKEYVFDDPDNSLTNVCLQMYQKESLDSLEDPFFDHFDTISLTHEEYNHLLSLQEVDLSTFPDFITDDHPIYIRSSSSRRYSYRNFIMLETDVSLGVPEVREENEILQINMSAYPEDIKMNDEFVVLRSLIDN